METKTIDNGQDLCEECINVYCHCEYITQAEYNIFNKHDWKTFEQRVLSCESYERDASGDYCPPPINQILLLEVV